MDLAVLVRQIQAVLKNLFGQSIAFGTATMPFGVGAGPVTVAVNHGLANPPTNIEATYRYGGNAGLFLYIQAVSATQITFRGVATAAPGADQTFDWHAIG